jgi:PKD repeat protein
VGWETGGFTITVKITSGNQYIYLAPTVRMISAAGVVRDTADSVAEQQLTNAQTYTFDIPSKVWTAATAGDRLRIGYNFRNAKSNTQSVTVSFNTSGTSVVSPIVPNKVAHSSTNSLVYAIKYTHTAITKTLEYAVHPVSVVTRFVLRSAKTVTETITTTSSWTPPTCVAAYLEYAVVGGGGGGGTGAGLSRGGGGGGGAYVAATMYHVTTAPISVTIGIGGTNAVSNGGDTIFGTITAKGGGLGGAGDGGAGSDGGSGGGAARSSGSYGHALDPAYGNNGGAGGDMSKGGGGGGAGAAGHAGDPDTGSGGDGKQFNGVWYAGGGRGGYGDADGQGGGGSANTGGGGRGGSNAAGTNGGSGIVAVRYPDPNAFISLSYSIRHTPKIQYALSYAFAHLTITAIPTSILRIPTNVTVVATDCPNGYVVTFDFDDIGPTVVVDPITSVHQYQSYGTFHISATATDGVHNLNSNIITMSIAEDTKPVAEWYPDVDFGPTPVTTKFYNYSSTYGGLANTYDWDFGDGTSHSSDTNPTHTFTTDDTFLVILTATNVNGSSTMVKSSITYSVEPDPVADFECTSPVGPWTFNVSLTVTDINGHTDTVVKTIHSSNMRFTTFKDLSVGKIKHWEWDFGDGNT